MYAVYRATYKVPSLRIEKDDLVVVDPAQPHAPLAVVTEHDRNVLPAILDHLEEFTLLTLSGAPSPSHLHERLRLAVGADARAPHLRLHH